MSRLSGELLVVRDAATKLSGDATSLLSFADGLVGDSTAMAALRLGVSAPVATGEGTGADGSDNYASSVVQGTTGIRKVEILIDIDGLISDATDNVVIGETGAVANCYFARLVAAEMGTPIAGTVLCLQTPTGGEPDLDFFGDASGTIAEGSDGSGDNSLLDRGADWAIGDLKVFTGMPDANDYLYITVGKSAGDSSEYTAGMFLVTIYGV